MRKFRKSVSFALAAFLIAALLPVNTVFADGDTNRYTVELHYDDNIQLLYQHKDGSAGWWMGVGDVPLGGATLDGGGAIPQLYCVDADVPFHSEIAKLNGTPSSLSNGYKDTVGDYVAVSPDKLPDSLRKHWNELSWLMVNGYSKPASLGTLNIEYANLTDLIGPLGSTNNGTSIEMDVAVMATKAAVWHYTNPDVVFLGTNFLTKSKGNPLSPSGVKHRQFVALMKALIADADKYAADPSSSAYTIPFEIAIDESSLSSPDTSIYGATYYGPYYINTTQGALGLDIGRVFLEIQGTQGGEIGFYSYANGTYTSIPNDLQKYGDNYWGPGIDKDDSFYIRVPSGLSLNDKRITALTRVTGGSTDMPIVLVHQNPNGSQDWNAIQAFIGLTPGNATSYASASLSLFNADKGTIEVTKTITPGVIDDTFVFRLTDNHWNPIYLGGTTLLPDYVLNGLGADGIFQLKTTSSPAIIGNLPVGNYIVTELYTVGHENDSVTYQVNSGTIFTGRVAQNIPLLSMTWAPTPTIEIVFTNSLPPAPTYINLSLHKRNENGDQALSGAAFTLTGVNIDYHSGEISTTQTGDLAFGPLPVPTSGINVFTLVETKSPQNHFSLMGPVSVKVNAAGDIAISADNPHDAGYISLSVNKAAETADITVRNELMPPIPPDTTSPSAFSIFIAKRSNAASDLFPALPDAKFILEKDGDPDTYNGTTGADGTLFFDFDNSVNFEGDYTLTEESAPLYYTKLKGSIDFTVSGGAITSVTFQNPDDAAHVTWLGIDDEEHNHEYAAFRIVDTYNPPTPPSSHNGPPPPEPEKPEVPTEPEEPMNPSPETPDTPDTPTPVDTGVLGHLPQTGDVADTAPVMPFMLLILLALCGVAAILRLREEGKRGPEGQ
jgi:hypothetical protein